jgi:hypothetical protein
VEECSESLNGESRSREVLGLKELAGYLKTEKELLKRMSDTSQKQQTS